MSDIVKCCLDCAHFYSRAADLSQPYPEFTCTKGHWEGISCQEDMDELSSETDCIDFKLESKSIYTHRQETIEAHDFIIDNRSKAYLGHRNNDFNYYNVNGIVWEWYHEGLGGYPTSDGMKVEDFRI